MASPPHHPAVRRAYDTVAASYADLLPGPTEGERAPLAAFAAAVAGGGPVGDLGCGTGRVAGDLAARGVAVVGVDLSPGMVAVARAGHPALPWAVGALDDLPLADGARAGALAWYSLIHTPPAQLGGVARELARVLRPGAPLLVGFQVGDGRPRHLAHAYGHDIVLDAYRMDPGAVTAALAGAGFTVVSTTIRSARPPETTPQAHLLARR